MCFSFTRRASYISKTDCPIQIQYPCIGLSKFGLQFLHRSAGVPTIAIQKLSFLRWAVHSPIGFPYGSFLRGKCMHSGLFKILYLHATVNPTFLSVYSDMLTKVKSVTLSPLMP